MSRKLIFSGLTLRDIRGDDSQVESQFSLVVEFLEPDCSSRENVFLIFSAILLPPSRAFVEELVPFGIKTQKQDLMQTTIEAFVVLV